MIARKRGKNVSIAGTLAQLVFAAVMLIIWQWTKSLAAMSCTLLLAAGLPLWLMTAFLFYVRQLERREAMEFEELASRGAAGETIFAADEGAELRPAAARSALMDRWIVPAFTLLWAGLHVLIGLLLIRHLGRQPPREIQDAAQGILLSTVIGFGAFLLSRYATGMGRAAQWRPLRATGSFLLLGALFAAAAIAALIGARQGNTTIDLVVAYAAAVVLFVLAAELVVNFVLDLYRPRIPGQEHRPSFDSRLLNLIAEPGRFGHSIAESLNYQFGFEVSRTWFYQLLAKAFVPLLIFAVLAMFAISSIVVVGQGEQYVVLHWGKADPQRGTLGAGLHFKWPWPIDTARRFETGRVHQILLGVGKRREPKIVRGRELYLWTEEHGPHEELDFLLAVPPRAPEAAAPTGQNPPPPINIIKLVAAVQYVIDKPYDFGFGYTDAANLLECVAYREMSRYCAAATLNSPIPGGSADRPEAIMTYGRKKAGDELKRRIQQKADELRLGVKIRYVGFSAVHPPSEAAEAYQAVLEAERRVLQTRYEAEADANRTLAEVAGRPLEALKLALAIRALEELEKLRDAPSRIAPILDEQIRQVGKDIAELDEEIEREHLLGLAAADGELTPKQELRRHYQEHLDTLEKIRQEPSKFPFVERIAGARKLADELFENTVGEPAKLVAAARAYRLDKELTEAARASAFERELLAYRASPNMYMMDRWLDVWDEVLPNITKYVIGVDRDKLELRLNWRRDEGFMGRAFPAEEK